MKRQNQIRSWKQMGLLLAALVIGLIGASYTQAQQPWRFDVQDHADNVNHLARNIRDEILHTAKHSRVFGPMLAETGKLEGNAAVLKAWARHEGPLDLLRQTEKLQFIAADLNSLLDEAQFRSDRGLDRPLLGTLRLRGMLAQVDGELSHIYSDIPQAGCAVPAAPFAPGPVGGGPFPGRFDNGATIDFRPTFGTDFDSGPRFNNDRGRWEHGQHRPGQGNHFGNGFSGGRGPASTLHPHGVSGRVSKSLTPHFGNGTNIYGGFGGGRVPPIHRSAGGITINGQRGSVRINF